MNNISADTKGSSSKRLTNIELLRILAMFLIVVYHFSWYGNFNFPSSAISANRLWTQFMQLGGKFGVNIFVLISGYFLVKSPEIKINKLVKLWFQVFTYSILIYLVFVISGVQSFAIKDVLKSLLPVTFSTWWFASAYIMLYLVSPFLNKFLYSIDKKTYQKIILLLTFCWCIIPTFTSHKVECNKLNWFIYLYMIAGYIRIHLADKHFSGKKYIIYSLICLALTYLSTIVFDILGLKISFLGNHAMFFYTIEKAPIVLASVFMFIGFLNLNVKHSKVINTVSSATFGVYLIHDHELVRNFLWNTLFNQTNFAYSKSLIIYSIFAVLSVYVVCTIIELTRKHTIERLFAPVSNKVSNIISKIVEKCCSDKFLSKW